MPRWRAASLGIALSLIAAALTAVPAGAAVQFTKQWVGGSEFLTAQWVATSPSGDVYVVDTGNSRISKLDPQGALLAQFGSFGGDPGQFNAPEGVATDSFGNLYVAEAFGNRVQKFDADGNFVRMWGKGVNQSNPGDICTAASGDTCQSGTSGSTGGAFNFANGVAVDSSDNVYVTDLGNRRVQKFDSNGNFERAWGFGVATGAPSFEICNVPADCDAGISGTGDGQFSNATGIVTDSLNNVYVADGVNDRIQKFDSSGNFTTKWGTSGSGAGQFNLLAGLGIDSSNNVYAADFGNNNIQTFSSTGAFINSWGKGVDQDTGGDFCTALSGHTCGAGAAGPADGQFNGLNGVAVDASGSIYTAETDNARVQKFAAPGAFAWKAGSLGSGGAFDAGINYLDVATGPGGDVYTSDHDTNRIQRFDPVGASKFAWGAPGTDDGEFDGPVGTAVDAAGNTYVVDQSNERIEKFDSGGAFLRAWGWGVDDGSNAFQVCTSSCQAGIAGAGDGQFDNPHGIATDASGNVYVADRGNNRIQKFSPSGSFLTRWGSAGAGNGQFQDPMDVAVDSTGNVYVVELVNNRVQRFSPSGAFLGKWGTSGGAPGQFEQPIAVATDSNRNVYVVDYVNARVQMFRPSGVFVKQWGTPGSGAGEFNGPSSIAIGSSGRAYVADAGNNRVEMFTETDTTAPQTTILSGPPGTTNDPTPTFTFSSSQTAGALFECRVDGANENDFKPCNSPTTLAHLDDGTHTLRVRAIDAAGNVDATPAARTFKVRTASVAISGSALVVNAAPGAKDNFKVTRPSVATIRVTDLPGGTYSGSGIHTGAGCTRVGDYRADCTAAGVSLIRTAAGALTDQVVNSTTIRGSLNGGPAADVLTGGSGLDTITGGPGPDAMKGMGGNDSLRGRDLLSDSAINCGPGTNDKADLDLLPKDAAVSGCEHITRH